MYRSGIAAAGGSLLLSVPRCCRLTHISGRSKVILRSPIPDASLQSIRNVPLILAEGRRGDVCVWNYEIGRVLMHSEGKPVSVPCAQANELRSQWKHEGFGCTSFLLQTLLGSSLISGRLEFSEPWLDARWNSAK
jgi:hypothetical protein